MRFLRFVFPQLPQLLVTFAAFAGAFLVSGGAARLVLSPPAAVQGCTPQQAKSARDGVITTTELVCVMNSTIIGDAEIAKACDIAQELLPVIRNLSRVRDSARRSGVVWAADGGAP